MSQAPERILAFESSDGQTWEESSEALKRDFPSGVEYIRADLLRPSEVMLASALAHRATHSAEHDPANGKLHGYCIVCGVPWPCETATQFIQKPLAALPRADSPEKCPECDGKKNNGFRDPDGFLIECLTCHGTGLKEKV